MPAQVINPSDPVWTDMLSVLRHDIYHLPDYLILEAQRIEADPEAFVFRQRDKIFFVPYLLRSCQGLFPCDAIAAETCDAVSPYGYPGILLSDAAMQDPDFVKTGIIELQELLSSRLVCSLFLRLHPILNQSFSEILASAALMGTPSVELVVIGDTVSVNLKLTASEIWNQTRADQRNKINRARRQGLISEIVDFEQYFEDFWDIYNETMQRVHAQQQYYSANSNLKCNSV